MSITLSLNELENSGLIRRAQIEPELEYIFRHALVQDASYESLLKADRRILHATVAQIIEELYPAQLDEFAATLADHYERAENYPQALDYYTRAGKAAARVYANAEAMLLFSRAIELLALPELHVAPQIASDLFSQYGRVLELAGKFEAAIENYRQMQAEAIRQHARKMEMDALIAQAIIQATPSTVHNIPQAEALCEQALVIASALEDREAESRLNWILLIIYSYGHDAQKSIEYGERSLAIARAINHRERLAFTLNDISRSYYNVGATDKADRALIEARALWEELGNLPMLSDNLISFAEAKLLAGEFDEGLAFAQRGYDISRKINNSWGQGFALAIQSNGYWYRGEVEACLECIQKMTELDPKRIPPFVRMSTATLLMEIYVEMGASDRAELAIEPLKHALTPAGDFLDGFFELGQAYIASARGDQASAQQRLEIAKQKLKRSGPDTSAALYIDTVEYNLALAAGQYAEFIAATTAHLQALSEIRPTDSFSPLLRYWRGMALLHNQQQAEASTELTAALTLSERYGMRHTLWRLHAALAEISSEGRAEHLRQAREVIHYIADHTPEDLRAAYLKMPEIQKIMGAA